MTDWQEIYDSGAYRQLVKRKTRAISVLTAFFLVYYFALPVLVGYWPEMMARPLLGKTNGAYLLAFSQFLMAWGVALVYMFLAGRYDARAESILAASGPSASPRK